MGRQLKRRRCNAKPNAKVTPVVPRGYSSEDPLDALVSQVAWMTHDGQDPSEPLGRIFSMLRGAISKVAGPKIQWKNGIRHEDSEQLVMMGMWDACSHWDPKKGRSRSFLIMVGQRKSFTARKGVAWQIPLDNGTYWQARDDVQMDERRHILEIAISGRDVAVEDAMIRQDELARERDALFAILTPLESGVLRRYLDGCGYLEIAQRMKTTTKVVDNALERIKRKAENLKL